MADATTPAPGSSAPLDLDELDKMESWFSESNGKVTDAISNDFGLKLIAELRRLRREPPAAPEVEAARKILEGLRDKARELMGCGEYTHEDGPFILNEHVVEQAEKALAALPVPSRTPAPEVAPEPLIELLWKCRDALQEAGENEDGLDGAVAEDLNKRLTNWIRYADRAPVPSRTPAPEGQQ